MKCEKLENPAASGYKQLDLLEARIEKLEEQILGKGKKQEELSKGPPVADLLLQTQLMISSALSCREAVLVILQRLNQINTYLDPLYGETELDTESKRQYLLELYPQLMKDLRVLGTLEKLAPMANSDNILKITDLQQKLDGLVIKNLSTYEEAHNVNKSVQKCLQEYFDITKSIKMVFTQLDAAISDVEKAMKPPVVIDE